MIANITTFLFMLSYFVRGKSLLKIRPKYLLPDLSLYPEIFGIGASSFVRTMAGSLLTIVANNTITEYGEELHLAILGISMRITIFFLMPLFGVVQGLRPILGFNYGAAA
ncbi:MAG: hypothetical protein U5N86_04520 [Planctomycetota bacterium]|nr:hypothetical protein [Planctomycetota bacterium]